MDIARDFSELDCLRRLRLGDERAFDALFRHYSALVYRFAYSYLKDRPEAEEIVQECFLKIWEKRDLPQSRPRAGAPRRRWSVPERLRPGRRRPEVRVGPGRAAGQRYRAA
ncbi:sigma factor [Hymenobacter gummosus]|uniref:sigma factor n=1 Tax=Hymenobacter gummosus TaxID=1776032 RepID=UPI001404CBA7